MLESPAAVRVDESYESSSSPLRGHPPRTPQARYRALVHVALAARAHLRVPAERRHAVLARLDPRVRRRHVPVAHPRSKSSQSMSAYGLRRPRVPSATNRAASTTAAVLYAQHPAHAPWCTTSPKSTWSLQSKESGRPEPSGPDASRADDEENRKRSASLRRAIRAPPPRAPFGAAARAALSLLRGEPRGRAQRGEGEDVVCAMSAASASSAATRDALEPPSVVSSASSSSSSSSLGSARLAPPPHPWRASGR